jgi:hypothetical protein
MMMPYYRHVVETPVSDLRHSFVSLRTLPYYAWTKNPTGHSLKCAVDGCNGHTSKVCLLCSLASSKLVAICHGHQQNHLSLNPTPPSSSEEKGESVTLNPTPSSSTEEKVESEGSHRSNLKRSREEESDSDREAEFEE